VNFYTYPFAEGSRGRASPREAAGLSGRCSNGWAWHRTGRPGGATAAIPLGWRAPPLVRRLQRRSV